MFYERVTLLVHYCVRNNYDELCFVAVDKKNKFEFDAIFFLQASSTNYACYCRVLYDMEI